MKKTNAFCSISTVNHLAYAAVLNESLRLAGHTEPHYILVVDDPEAGHSEIFKKSGFQSIFLHQLSIPGIDELIKKYSAFELCNVLKPFFMKWLLVNHTEIKTLVYLDTDIYVYSQLRDVFDHLDSNKNISVALVPHLNDTTAYLERSDYRLEESYFTYGLYNGGFYIVKNNADTLQFLEWHAKKIVAYGYNAPEVRMFVDQKMLDFAPILFNFVSVYQNKTYNVAYWNYSPGLLQEKNNKYYADGKELVFYHFAQIPEGDALGNFMFDVSPEDARIFKTMVAAYTSKLDACGHQKLKIIPYGHEARYKKPALSVISPLAAKAERSEKAKKALEDVLQSMKEEVKIKNDMYAKTEEASESVRTKHEVLVREHEVTVRELASVKAELNDAYSSLAWRMATTIRTLAGNMAPAGSARRNITFSVWKSIKRSRRSFLFLALRMKAVGVQNRPKKQKNINTKSKKVAIICHSYHKKTKSSEFFIDLLRQSFDVEVIWDESAFGKPFADLSHLDGTYHAIIFWQNLPNNAIFRNIPNENLIFVPMYDAVGTVDYGFVQYCKDFKIVSFSKTLHDAFVSFGLDSLYVQYFPEPRPFTPGNKNEIFFWQRTTNINVNTVIKLVGKETGNKIEKETAKERLRIHIHKAIDPYHQFTLPAKKALEAFDFTYSEWFATKEAMLDVIKQKGIYIAPREREGIGMSFLEAMAMGKAVIACDNPTMNEYIEHGKTGYLFDLAKPRQIDLSNLDTIQKNTYTYMQEGFKRWEKEKQGIITFIKRP